VLIVVFVGGFAWPGFFTGSSTSSPTDVAHAFIKVAKSGDLTSEDALALFCTRPSQQQIDAQRKEQQEDPTTVSSASMVGNPQVSGNTAKVTVSVTATDHGPDSTGKPETSNLTISMQQQNGTWCIVRNNEGGAPPTQPSEPTLPSDFPSTDPGSSDSGSDSDDNGFSDSGAPSMPSEPSAPSGAGTGG
jgi:hypothetical protein